MPAETRTGIMPSKLLPSVRRAALEEVEAEPSEVDEPEPLAELPVEEAEEPVAVEAGVVPFGLPEKLPEVAKTCDVSEVLTNWTL